ncbi:hypothetical protein ACIU1J_01095 [Azospirillum doebereinerae]|uniref:hypothetical protein n=1 Tax=Azospirillum doebereinerae TaxID=92933 RepID=UPI001EE59B6D|nr:hypothetical protein [Azospirillum doebereinerae]MCG5239191.1 hypothetical protein [Azospirillum doebereinerae]
MGVIPFPLTNRGVRHPTFPVIEVSRLSLDEAADWQANVMAECRRRRVPTSSLADWLETRGLLLRCTVLSSDGPGEPLRIPGQALIPALNGEREPGAIHHPGATDPHLLAQTIGVQCAENVSAGEAVLNRILVSGIGCPFVHTHAFYGWEDKGRRRVLSAVDIQTLH